MPDTVLVVDDDALVRRLLKRCFESEGYVVLEAVDSCSLYSLLDKHPVDLITLDLSLGDENGLDLALEIRKRSDVGIIVVSGKGELIDTVVGLEMGADDYISKPFEVREVLARARSVLRRTRRATIDTSNSPVENEETLRFSRWRMNLDNRCLTDDEGRECSLTSAEYKLLHVLVSNAGRVMSRDHIMDKIKGHNWSPNDRSIDNQIARLRKKIDPENQLKAIKSVRSVGYVFSLPVSREKTSIRASSNSALV